MNNFVDLVRLFRPNQWIKNGFVFVGVLFAHQWHDVTLLLRAFFAAVAFCLISSATYVFNDIVDRRSDQHHPISILIVE